MPTWKLAAVLCARFKGACQTEMVKFLALLHFWCKPFEKVVKLRDAGFNIIG